MRDRILQVAVLHRLLPGCVHFAVGLERQVQLAPAQSDATRESPALKRENHDGRLNSPLTTLFDNLRSFTPARNVVQKVLLMNYRIAHAASNICKRCGHEQFGTLQIRF